MKNFMRIFNIASLIFLLIYLVVTIFVGDDTATIITSVLIIIDIADIIIHYNDF